jgi:hypothetical protein
MEILALDEHLILTFSVPSCGVSYPCRSHNATDVGKYHIVFWGNGGVEGRKRNLGTFVRIPVLFTSDSFAIPDSAREFRAGSGHERTFLGT